MLQAIKESQQTEMPSFDALQLPNNLPQLLEIYENDQASFIRVCVLSKIKQIIICEVHHQPSAASLSFVQQDESVLPQSRYSIQKQIFYEDGKNANTIFSAFFLRFLRRGQRNRVMPKNELQLFYHVISLVIKYFYSEEHFKFLFNEITELIENHKQRIQTAIQFFIEVIDTIEFNYQECLPEEKMNTFGAKINHCKFERHFTTSHLNSMLMIANFFMQRAILKDNDAIEDGLYTENFKIKATEEHISSILQLLHKVLCFDFIGEKYSENEDNSQTTNIIIPTKNTKYTNLSQFQKWLKNSDWIRVYQFIYQSCQMVKIKLNIIQIFGDMARIHMKYFKNKACFKVHIENVVYALADILEQALLSQSKEDLLRISIAFGRNLVKLTSPAIVPIFFEINSNLYAGILENVKNFLVDQIITEDVFNVNIIYYFFKFLYNLHVRCKFQRSNGPFELIERVTRQICRNYQNYLRVLLKKLFKCTSQKVMENFQIRQDYLHMRQTFESYNSEEIMIYLSPFQFMKPRYTSINCVEQLFVLVCAKVTRSLYIIETFPQNIREREFAMQMIEKSILQTIQWFTFTTYYKSLNKDSSGEERQRITSSFPKKFADNFELTMESINEEYEEEIQNQFEYCHMLRVICFYFLECIDRVPEHIYKNLNGNNQIFKLINFCIEICFQADLQDDENRSQLNISAKSIIQEQIQLCRRILERLCLQSWEYWLFLINRDNSEGNFPYRFKIFENQYEMVDQGNAGEQVILIQAIKNVKSPFSAHNQLVVQTLKQIEVLLAYSIAKEEKTTIQKYSIIETLEDCSSFILVILENHALLSLLRLKEPIITAHFDELLRFLREYQLQQNNLSEISRFLEVTSLLIKIKVEEIEEEMTNRLFLFLHQIIGFLQMPQQICKVNEQLAQCLHKIDEEHIITKKDIEFQQLHCKIGLILETFAKNNQP